MKGSKGPTPQQVSKFKNNIYWTDKMRACFHEIVAQLKAAAELFLPRWDRPFWVRWDSSQYAIGAALEQKSCACPDDMECSCLLRPEAFFSRKLQGDPGMGQRAWHITEKTTFAIVATVYKFGGWLAGQQVRVKVLTDHKGLETRTKEDFDTMSGPIGRRGRWHQFLAKFQLEIVYVKVEDQTVPDVMSRPAFPAAHAAPDVSIMGSQADLEWWETGDKEERQWADSQVARDIPPEFVRTYGACCRQFASVCSARDQLQLSSVVSDFPSPRRIYEEEQSCEEIHQRLMRNLKDRFSVPSRPHRSQKRQLRTCARIMMSRTGHIRV